MNTILVQVAGRRWTMQAMHLACGMARYERARVALLQLLPISHPMLLGTPLGMTLTPEQHNTIKEFALVAEDYGVEIELVRFQYLSLVGALVQAAEEMNASVVFAHLPEQGFSLFRKYQKWNLEHQLGKQKRQLCLLDEQPQTEVPPMVSLKDVR